MSVAAAQQSTGRILLIAYHFPPSSAVGGLRAANFARCLRAFGWEPHVLTIRDRDMAQIDRSRERWLDGITIHHAAVLPTIEGLYSAAIRRWRRNRRLTLPSAAGPVATASPNGKRTETLKQRVKRYILSMLALPDRERGWLPTAVIGAVTRIRRHRMGWIMTSCPPYSVHVVGVIVKRLTGVKWIADFRDPWMTTGSKRLFPTSALSLAIERWLERRVIERADLVVFNVERLRNAYRDRYRTVPRGKLVFIPNAVSSRAVPDRTAAPKYDRFTLTYTGSLYLGRSPEPVFKALATLIAEGRLAPNGARLVLAGQCDNIEGVPTLTVAGAYGLENMVEVQGTVSYEAAMENSASPVTQEYAGKMMALGEGPPTFYNLDVLDDRS